MRVEAEILQVAGETVVDEHHQIRLRGFRPVAVAFECRVGQLAQRDVESMLHQDADRGPRRSAQSERVLVTGRNLPDAEQARERVELFSERYRARSRSFRQPIAGEAR